MTINQHDVILIDGVRHTVLSWPAEPANPGAVAYVEQYDPTTRAAVQRTIYVSQHVIEETGDATRPSFGTPGVDAPVEVPSDDGSTVDVEVESDQVTIEDAIADAVLADPVVEDAPVDSE